MEARLTSHLLAEPIRASSLQVNEVAVILSENKSALVPVVAQLVSLLSCHGLGDASGRFAHGHRNCRGLSWF